MVNRRAVPALPLLVLTVILLLAALMRIYNLVAQSLWLDEGFTWWAVEQPDMFAALAANTSPPLYFMGLRLWMDVAGDSILAMRYFTVLPSVLSVAVVYQVARMMAQGGVGARHAVPLQGQQRRWGAYFVPILATLLFALSDADIHLAQEIRMYGVRKLLVVLSVWLYLLWLRKPTAPRAAAWVLVNAALPYAQYLGAYLPVFEGLHALIYLRGRLRSSALALLALSAALFMPWFVGVTVSQMGFELSYEMLNSPPSNAATLSELGHLYLGGQWALMIGLMALGVWAVWQAHRPGDGAGESASKTAGLSPLATREGGWTVFLLLWLVLPVAITFVINLNFPLLMPRNVALITPAIAILVARGVGAVTQRPARWMLIAVLLVYGLSEVDYYHEKERWDHVGDNLARYAVPGGVALAEVGFGDFALLYYMEHGLPPGMPIRSLRMWREEAGQDYPGELLAFLAERPPVWLANWGDNLILRQLEDMGYTQTMTLTVDNLGNALNAHRYDALPADPVATFANGLVLRQVELLPEIGRVDLWWSAVGPLDRDYTVSAFLLDEAGQLAAQADSYPFADSRPTTGWPPGAVVYDPRPLDVAGLLPGMYTVGVKVYTWQDGVVVPTGAGDDFAVVGTWAVP